jgi:putative exosortase-associated protein (TIGR04073 family)
VGQIKRVCLTAVAITLAATLLWQSAPVFAQDSNFVVETYQSGTVYDPYGELPRPTGIEKSLTKLGRGISNVLLGWAEIPVAFDRGVKRGKPLGYLLGVSPVLGTARAFMRTTTGVFEMVTFPFSDRDVNYEPILEPEYIF